MNQKAIAGFEWSLGVLLFFFGNLFYQFTYYLQENAYHRPNILVHISTFLNDQVSGTSFGVVLSMCGLGIALSVMLRNYKNPFVLATRPLGLAFIGAFYTWYEINQYKHPSYPDNNGLDILVCWIAVLTVAFIWAHGIKRKIKQAQVR